MESRREGAAWRSGAVTTAFGVFNPNPGPNDRIIPRNFGTGPGSVKVDLYISKEFTLWSPEDSDESRDKGRGLSRMSGPFQNLTLSADIQNLLNHTNLSKYSGVLASPFFGRANRAQESRRITLGVRLSF